MKGFNRQNQLLSLCGLNCGLCPMFLNKNCPGCGGGEGNQSCKIARCSMEHSGVEYCFIVLATEVVITKKYTGGGSGGGGSTPTPGKPSVTIGGDGNGGKVEADRDGTITPDKGYEIGKITVNGKEVEIPADGKLTGLKPTDKVVVTFEEVQPNIPVSQRFTDVKAGSWYEKAIQFAVDHGLFYGTSDNTFAPNSSMTRGMLVTVLYRLAKEPETGTDDLFNDVAGDKYYTEAVKWAAKNGVVAGYGNGEFGPEDSITREQLATILYRYAGNPAPPNLILDFVDENQTSGFALDALRWAVDMGIIAGKGNGILDPKGKATRAEVAAMLMRYCTLNKIEERAQ